MQNRVSPPKASVPASAAERARSLQALIDKEFDYWGEVIKTAGIKGET